MSEHQASIRECIYPQIDMSISFVIRSTRVGLEKKQEHDGDIAYTLVLPKEKQH
jgi:hypothetical protein